MLEALIDWAQGPEHKGQEFLLVLVTEGDLQLPARRVVNHGPGWVAVITESEGGCDRQAYYNEAHIASAWVEWVAT
jgi:hypothetical protein